MENVLSQPAAIRQTRPLLAIMAGLSATLVGLGLGRFAYTPLVPSLIAAQWFAPSTILYFSAANLAGYLIGALVARPLASRFPTVALLRAAMVLTTFACFAGAWPISPIWFFAWRMVAGITGGIIMVLAAATVLAVTKPERRGLVGGLVFTGVGLGVAASGTLVPLLLRDSLVEAWLGLGVLSGVLTLLAWFAWPPAPAPAASPASLAPRRMPLAVTGLTFEYGLNAVALVPHMVFLVDFAVRGLHLDLAQGASLWVAYGIGAMAGPMLGGFFADRFGFRTALRAAYVLQAMAALLPLLTADFALLAVSSAVMGAFTPGIVSLTLGRSQELLPGDTLAQRKAWSRITISFALGQAVAAYGLTYVFQIFGSYRPLFFISLGALALAMLLNLTAQIASGRIVISEKSS